MRNILMASALLSAAAIAAPAAAQYQPRPQPQGQGYYQPPGQGYYHPGGQGIRQQLGQIVERIRRSADRGRLSRGEANRLLRFADQTDRVYDRYRRNGISQWEQRDLQNRLQNLRHALRNERQDGRQGNWNGQGRDNDDRWDRDDDDRWDRDDD